MVRCPTEVDLERYLAGATSAAERASVDAHLGACPACRAWIDEASRDEDLLPHLRRGLAEPLVEDPTAAAGLDPAPPRYRVVSRLGGGGMGVVLEAEQDRPRRRVALKVLSGVCSPRAVRRFEVEAEALARLDHEGIARIHEAGVFETPDGPRPFIAMELVCGRPLDAWLRVEAPPVARRLALFLQIADAVEHAHRKGVVHRDLKPANVLVRDDGRPKVVDFGIARLSDTDGGDQRLATQAGQLLGTVAYMSPEQASGDPAAVDTQSDVYALGVVLYEMLTGALPYAVRGRGTAELLQAIEAAQPVPPRARVPTLDRDLETITLHALAKRPAERYGSVAELAADVRRFLRTEPIAARPAGAAERLAKLARRHRALVAGAALLLLVLLAGLGATALQARRARAAEALATRQLSRSEAVASVLRRLLGGTEPGGRARPAGFTLREALDEASALLEAGLPDTPEVEANLRVTLGNAYAGLAELDRAEEHLERALALRRAARGARAVPVAEVLNALGMVRAARGRPAEACGLFEEALAIYAAELAPDDLRLATARANLGTARLVIGDLGGAEAALAAALDAFERASTVAEGEALALAGLAAVERARGRPAAARRLQERALARYRALLGDAHPQTRLAQAVSALELSVDGRHAEAVALLSETLAALEAFHGPMHPDVARVHADLARALLASGAAPAAEEHARRAVALRRTAPAGAGLAGALAVLAQVFEHRAERPGPESLQGLAEAADALAEAVALRRRFLPGATAGTLALELRRARALHALGRIDEASAAWATVADAPSADGVEQGPAAAPGLAELRAEACRRLGSLAWRSGAPEEAARRYEQALALFAAADPERWRERAAESGLAAALLELARFDEAVAVFAAAVAAAERDPTSERWMVLRLRNNLAAALRLAGELDRARALLEGVVAEGERDAALGEPFLAGPRNNLAHVLREAGELELAEEQARRALAAWTERLGRRHRNTLTARRTLATVLLAAGRTDEALAELEPLVPLAREALADAPQRLGEILATHGLALSAAGAGERAAGSLAEARDLLVRVRPAEHPSVREVTAALVELGPGSGRSGPR